MASSTLTASMSTCYLLDVTPPEIRNRIYELVFNDHPDSVELPRAQPPTKTLLLTCRQVHAEGRLVQRDAYRTYWSTTRFTIHIGQDMERNRATVAVLSDDPAVSDVEAQRYGHVHRLEDGDVSHISTLRLRNERSWTPFALDLFEDGIWTCLYEKEEYAGPRTILVSSKHAETLEEAGFDVYRMCRSPSYAEVMMHDCYKIELTDAEIATVKRTAGYCGLTKLEILALINAQADTGMRELLGLE